MTDTGARLALAAALALALAAPTPLAAQGFDVPDGFTSDIVRRGGLGPEVLSVLRVRPEEGGFAGLSRVELAPLPDAPEAPDSWLRERVTASLDIALPDPRTALGGADSPFADPAFDELRAALGRWADGIARLGDWPLRFCDAPEDGRNRAGSLREMRCTLPFGPFRQHLVMRLQEVDGMWYHTRIATMNARRLGDLVAIADSFHTGFHTAPPAPGDPP